MFEAFGTRHAVLGLVAAITLFGCGGAEESAELSPEETLGTSESELFGLWEEPTSIKGLPGSFYRYSWLTPSEEIISFTLTGTFESETYGGTYTRKVKRTCRELGCDTETGNFRAIPINPAIGAAAIAFMDEDDQTRDIYRIVSIRRNDFTGNLLSLKLAKWNDDNTFGTEFTVNRIGY
ncbi:MAG: hypothetical protein WBV82_22050 [Myxococcaceae bacterium]